MDGTLQTNADQRVLRFERDLNHPVHKVWTHLTDPTRWTDWLAENGEVELRVGGRVFMKDHDIDSTIVALEPPRLIEYGWEGPKWSGGTVRWELSPTSDGTRLVLTHKFEAMSPEKEEEFKKNYPDLPDDWKPVPSTLAGWHSILERLLAAVDGSPIPESMDRWRELHNHYKETVGVG